MQLVAAGTVSAQRRCSTVRQRIAVAVAVADAVGVRRIDPGVAGKQRSPGPCSDCSLDWGFCWQESRESRRFSRATPATCWKL